MLMRSVRRAAEEVLTALTIDATHPIALLLRGRIAYYTGNLKEARETLMNVRGGAESSEAITILAESCVAGGEAAQADSLYTRLLETEADDPVLCAFIRARLLRVINVNHDLPARKERTPPLRLELQKLSGNNSLAGLAISEDLLSSGNLKEADSTLVRLQESETIKPNTRMWYQWQIARLRFYRGEYLSSCDWYAKIAADEIDSLSHREYVHALYRAGLIPAAQQRAKAIRAKNGRVVHGITEIEADALAQAGNFRDARGLILELVADRPHANHLLLSLARLYAITGDFDHARKFLSEINEETLAPELQEELKALSVELAQNPNVNPN
jgi:tetratricopeptide (TPR) repeat protein